MPKLKVGIAELESYQTALTIDPFHREFVIGYYNLLNKSLEAIGVLRELFPTPSKPLDNQLNIVKEYIEGELKLITINGLCGCGDHYYAYEAYMCPTCEALLNAKREPNTYWKFFHECSKNRGFKIQTDMGEVRLYHILRN